MLEIKRYGRYWSVTEDGELLCVAVYRKGAKALTTRIEALIALLAKKDLEQRKERNP